MESNGWMHQVISASSGITRSSVCQLCCGLASGPEVLGRDDCWMRKAVREGAAARIAGSARHGGCSAGQGVCGRFLHLPGCPSMCAQLKVGANEAGLCGRC